MYSNAPPIPIPTWLVVAVLSLLLLAVSTYFMSHTALGSKLAAPLLCSGGGHLEHDVATRISPADPMTIGSKDTTVYDVTQRCVWPDGRESQVRSELVWAVLAGELLAPLLLISAPLLLVRSSRRLAQLNHEEKEKERRRAEIRARYQREREQNEDR